MAAGLFIGLMSGTSLDGVDGVLATFSDNQRPRVHASASLPMPPDLRRQLLALNTSGDDELVRAALAGNTLARLYAQAVEQLLGQAGAAAADVAAIGAHGQTVRHAPDAGYTIQVNAPALLAELTGIDVVADFRARDVAAGGQGAPLVPAFHCTVFSTDYPRAILNLGGIANVTLLSPQHEVRGFDTGPANVLLDTWCRQQTGRAYDASGEWAATGHVHEGLLKFLIDSEPWFAKPAPKSTGRDLFNFTWLSGRLDRYDARGMAPNDVQATLQALTARTVAEAIGNHAPETREVLVCGGGALNIGLMNDLRRYLERPVLPTSDYGVPALQVEALAFAWLARAHLKKCPAALPTVTGARHASILGGLYPA